jgi:hypothetical protein
VAQVIIKFVDDEGDFSGTSSELHNELKPVAEKLGVDRDKAWPKSARSLWRRIKEVLSLLLAAGIEATRSETRTGSIITLRKTSATDATTDENRTGKADSGGNNTAADATVDATDAPNATGDATRNPADRAENGNSGNSGNSRGDSAEAPLVDDLGPGESATLAELKARRLLKNPPGWLQDQVKHARGLGFPQSQLNALAASIAAVVCGDATKGEEVLPVVVAFLNHGLGCDCEECM